MKRIPDCAASPEAPRSRSGEMRFGDSKLRPCWVIGCPFILAAAAGMWLFLSALAKPESPGDRLQAQSPEVDRKLTGEAWTRGQKKTPETTAGDADVDGIASGIAHWLRSRRERPFWREELSVFFEEAQANGNLERLLAEWFARHPEHPLQRDVVLAAWPSAGMNLFSFIEAMPKGQGRSLGATAVLEAALTDASGPDWDAISSHLTPELLHEEPGAQYLCSMWLPEAAPAAVMEWLKPFPAEDRSRLLGFWVEALMEVAPDEAGQLLSAHATETDWQPAIESYAQRAALSAPELAPDWIEAIRDPARRAYVQNLLNSRP